MRRAAAAILCLAMVLALAAPVLANDAEPWGKDDKGTTIEKILAWPFSFPLRIADAISEYAGFQTFDKLVFLHGVSEADRKNLPWTSATEKANVMAWYWILAIVTAPFYALAFVSAGLRLIKSGVSGNPGERQEAQEDLYRWVLGIVLVGVMPVLVTALMAVTHILLDAISLGFGAVMTDRSVADWGRVPLSQMDFSTGSVLGTALLRTFFAIAWFYLNCLYIVRRVCLTGMLAFTPLAALIWTVNRKTPAISIWLGEIASNAFMPVAHALVLCTILVFCDVKDTQNTWVTLFIALFTFVPLSEAIRNSMMSLIARLGGVSEVGTAVSAGAALLGLGSVVGLGRAGKALLSSGGKVLGRLKGGETSGEGKTSGGGLGGSAESSGASVTNGTPVPPVPHPTFNKAPTSAGSGASGKPAGSVLGRVAQAGAKVGSTVGRVAGGLVGAVGSAIPGGEKVGEAFGSVVGGVTGAVAGGAAGTLKYAWELGRNPAETWAETKQLGQNLKEKAKSGVQSVQNVGRDVATVGKNIGKAGVWTGQQVAAGASRVAQAGRYALQTARSWLV